MSGLNLGIAKGHFVGLRIATKIGAEVAKRKVTYIPGYTRNDGKAIPACCKMQAFVNHPRKDEGSIYTVTAWGKLADRCAKGMSPGKEFHADVRIESYYGRVWNNAGTLLTNPDGSEVKVLKHNFIIEDMRFGADGNKFVESDIAAGKRPQNWNDGGPGTEAWLAVLKARNDYTYDGTSDTFGYAKVVKPNTATAAAGAGLPAEVENATGGEALKEAFGKMGDAVVDLKEPF